MSDNKTNLSDRWNDPYPASDEIEHRGSGEYVGSTGQDYLHDDAIVRALVKAWIAGVLVGGIVTSGAWWLFL